MPSPVHVRQPLAFRLYAILFGIIWCGFLAVAIVGLFPGPQMLFPLAMLAFGGTLIYRMFRMEAVADANGLLVRNYLRTKRFQWAEIEGFRVGTPTMGMFGKTIYALLTDGEMVGLDVTMQLGLLPSGRRKREALLAELRQWRDQAK